jgi:hypothetical protein
MKAKEFGSFSPKETDLLHRVSEPQQQEICSNNPAVRCPQHHEKCRKVQRAGPAPKQAGERAA